MISSICLMTSDRKVTVFVQPIGHDRVMIWVEDGQIVEIPLELTTQLTTAIAQIRDSLKHEAAIVTLGAPNPLANKGGVVDASASGQSGGS